MARSRSQGVGKFSVLLAPGAHGTFICATLALAACATIPAASIGPTAQLGEVAAVGSLRVRPLRIVEDSRCPINAHCIWAGRLILRAEIRGSGKSETRDLTLGEPLAGVDGKLTLVIVEPGKLAGSEKPLPYKFTFAFTAK